MLSIILSIILLCGCLDLTSIEFNNANKNVDKSYIYNYNNQSNFKKNKNSTTTLIKTNLIKTNITAKSIKNNVNINISIKNSSNITNKHANNIQYNLQYKYINNVEKIFPNLNYSDEIRLKDTIIKKYKNYTLVVTKKPINLADAYKYNNVKKYIQQDKYGYFIIYEFISIDGKNVSYTFYRKVGDWYIILQSNQLNKDTYNFWNSWCEYISKIT